MLEAVLQRNINISDGFKTWKSKTTLHNLAIKFYMRLWIFCFYLFYVIHVSGPTDDYTICLQESSERTQTLRSQLYVNDSTSNLLSAAKRSKCST